MKASDVFTLFLEVCKYVLIRAGVRGAWNIVEGRNWQDPQGK